MGRDSLAPGFRFHPTDEELVSYYLKRKVSGKALPLDPISVVDIYKSEPWDLPGKSKLQTRDLEWYFFSPLDKKYGNSSRTNRATEKGYWKTTGKDRPVHHNKVTVGMKKTLVYHSGRAPHGIRTNWVMHEYKLSDAGSEKSGIAKDAFVLCRLFQKSGTGPKNGERYGAPFIEEEWEDDEDVSVAPVSGQVSNEMLVRDATNVEVDCFPQNLYERMPVDNGQLPSKFYHVDTSNVENQQNKCIEDDQKPVVGTGETWKPPDGEKVSGQYGLAGVSVEEECFQEPGNNINPVDAKFLLDDRVFDDALFTEPLFHETYDLSKSSEPDSTDFDMLEECLNFFDAENGMLDMSFDPSEIMGGEMPVSDHGPLTEKLARGAIDDVPMERKYPSNTCYGDAGSSSDQNAKAMEKEKDMKSPFINRASQMLDSIPAPPAFASEFPSEDAVLLLNRRAQASGLAHVTAGMIELRSETQRGNDLDGLFRKNGDVKLVLSVGASQGDISSSPFCTVSGKTGSLLLFLFTVFMMLVLCVTFKVGSCVHSR